MCAENRKTIYSTFYFRQPWVNKSDFKLILHFDEISKMLTFAFFSLRFVTYLTQRKQSIAMLRRFHNSIYMSDFTFGYDFNDQLDRELQKNHGITKNRAFCTVHIGRVNVPFWPSLKIFPPNRTRDRTLKNQTAVTFEPVTFRVSLTVSTDVEKQMVVDDFFTKTFVSGFLNFSLKLLEFRNSVVAVFSEIWVLEILFFSSSDKFLTSFGWNISWFETVVTWPMTFRSKNSSKLDLAEFVFFDFSNVFELLRLGLGRKPEKKEFFF